MNDLAEKWMTENVEYRKLEKEAAAFIIYALDLIDELKKSPWTTRNEGVTLLRKRCRHAGFGFENGSFNGDNNVMTGKYKGKQFTFRYTELFDYTVNFVFRGEDY